MSASPDIMSGEADIRNSRLNQPIIYPSLALLLGALLALISIHLNLWTGWIGGIGLVGWAILAKRGWAIRETFSEFLPNASERVLRLRAIGLGLLTGHLCTALLHPSLDLRLGNGNSLAIDSWTMIAGLLIASLVFRADEKTRDERDEKISAKGMRTGYWTLTALLTILIFMLAPTQAPPSSAWLTPFNTANIIVALIMTSLLANYTVQLLDYASQTRAARSADANDE